MTTVNSYAPFEEESLLTIESTSNKKTSRVSKVLKVIAFIAVVVAVFSLVRTMTMTSPSEIVAGAAAAQRKHLSTNQHLLLVDSSARSLWLKNKT